MERKLYETTVHGNAKLLVNLLEEDALLLDRFLASDHDATALHVASMLGHVEFVNEILGRKPELARKVDHLRSSSLHLAVATGNLEIVKRLIEVEPDMCLVRDREGKNPLHIAAIRGHVGALRELVRARPVVARAFMD